MLDEIRGYFREYWSRLEPSTRREIGVVVGSSRALLVLSAAASLDRPILVVVSDQPAMEEMVDDLEFFGLSNADRFWESSNHDPGKDDRVPPPVLPFPHLETLPYEHKPPESHLKSDRLRVFEILSELAEPNRGRLPGRRVVLVAPVRALQTRVPDLTKIRSSQRVLRMGGEVDRDELAAFLLEEGYEAVELVAESGQFSVRGGIVDVFPFTSTEPVRIELFGDEIDSMRTFDLFSQRSQKRLDHLVLGSADEMRQLVSTWRRSGSLRSLTEFLPSDALVFWDHPDLIAKESERVRALAEKMFVQRSFFEDEGEIETENPLLDIPPDSLYRDHDGLREETDRLNWVDLSEFAVVGGEDARQANLPVSRPNLIGLDFKMKIQDAMRRSQEGERFLVVCDNTGQMERLKELFLDARDEKAFPNDPDAMRRDALRSEKVAGDYTSNGGRRRKRIEQPFDIQGIQILVGAARKGFACEETRLTLVTDQEIFGRFRKIRTRRKHGVGTPIVELVDLAPGDVVVHVDHGIGRFVGLKRLTVGGREGEFLELRYEGEDVLYVPIEQIDRVSRYVGSGDALPKLSKLGGKVWQATKARAKKAIEDLTGKLLGLYAAREVSEGFNFPSDTPWQHEFEASFPYDETPDQWHAIEDVKRDMESPRCMDRLICGDVGFGKTEVAMRAAFKAVSEGKQVAVLAPTTVLVQQHFETFADRMVDYPVAIESISRFRSSTEQRAILKKTEWGEIDILIGTHRILQKDVRFRDLALVVIDEEQRFGVKHKERLKELRTRVDVLSLTATPIPRTLYMSLSGVRDMSMVNTPPKDRLPIETYVVEYKPEIVESAILRELARGGQVFFLHNRVESIYGMGNMVQEVVPEARVAVAHGQMEGHELERAMHRFIAGEIDVLVSTTIIESGLDIPNANTILVNRADTFGLAELYQLRGRVGRAKHQAYCYLLVPSRQSLTPIARQRLLALQEHTALGSGFHIAMKDLEIRGMGNILGREQHGHIAAIGYDLYSSLLAKEVKRIRGRQMGEETTTIVETWRPGEFPADYVPSPRQRMSLHKRMAALETGDQIRSLREEIEDLYGRLPPSAELVFANLELRQLARKARVDHLRIRPQGARLRLNDAASAEFSPEMVVELDRAYPGKIRLSVDRRIYLQVLPPGDENLWETAVTQVLKALAEFKAATVRAEIALQPGSGG